MKSKASYAALLMVLVSCASPIPVQLHGVQVAEESQVSNCHYLDTVQGASSWYGMFAQHGIDNARDEALRQTREIGATHIVWIPLSQGYGSTQVSGKAYRCDGSK